MVSPKIMSNSKRWFSIANTRIRPKKKSKDKNNYQKKDKPTIGRQKKACQILENNMTLYISYLFIYLDQTKLEQRISFTVLYVDEGDPCLPHSSKDIELDSVETRY